MKRFLLRNFRGLLGNDFFVKPLFFILNIPMNAKNKEFVMSSNHFHKKLAIFFIILYNIKNIIRK